MIVKTEHTHEDTLDLDPEDIAEGIIYEANLTASANGEPACRLISAEWGEPTP